MIYSPSTGTRSSYQATVPDVDALGLRRGGEVVHLPRVFRVTVFLLAVLVGWGRRGKQSDIGKTRKPVF